MNPADVRGCVAKKDAASLALDGLDQRVRQQAETALHVTEAGAAAQEARRDLAVLLAELPDRQRLPIQYVKIEGVSVAEAAQRTGLSASAVKIGVHRGLKRLAAKLRESR